MLCHPQSALWTMTSVSHTKKHIPWAMDRMLSAVTWHLPSETCCWPRRIAQTFRLRRRWHQQLGQVCKTCDSQTSIKYPHYDKTCCAEDVMCLCVQCSSVVTCSKIPFLLVSARSRHWFWSYGRTSALEHYEVIVWHCTSQRFSCLQPRCELTTCFSEEWTTQTKKT